MWRPLLHRIGVLMHTELIRQPNARKVNGIFSSSHGNGLLKGDIISLVPFFHCLTPNTAVASPWGKKLIETMSSYCVEGNGLRVEYSKESAITTAFCALVMTSSGGFLSDYLRWISLEESDDSQLRHKLGESGYAKLQCICAQNVSIVKAMHEDVTSVGWTVPIHAMQRAHAICSSRCADIPRSDDIFGGPALVPFVDLINHSEEEPNVVVYVDTLRAVLSDLQQVKSLPLEYKNILKTTSCPFYVVVRSSRDVLPGEELHYCYAPSDEEGKANDLFWAARFGFCP